MKYRGVAYYPEVWPKERWDVDIKMMREAHINLTRMGEFAWSKFEPRDNQFDLDWWRDICRRMQKADIQVLACTPSAAPPAWLPEKHPEILLVEENNKPKTHGSRRHYCPTSPVFREYAARVNRAMAESVSDNNAVVAWQIDNEIDVAPCFCPRCAEGFREWLQKRYGTLEDLNNAWGNGFWSGDFSSWDQIMPPLSYHRVSWRLDYRRFQDDIFIEFIEQQAEDIRAVRRDWSVTTNQWAGINPAADSTRYFETLDFAAYDGYWDYYADREFYSSIWDFYRNIKHPARPFWLAETNAWNPASTVENGLRALRPWAYEAFAKGASAHVYFRWRQSIMGEEDHPAVLDWSGRPGRAYKVVKELFGEMEKLAPRVDELPLPDTKTAILFDYSSAVCGEMENRDYRNRLVRVNVLLNRMQVLADILPVRQCMEIEKYKLLILPQLEIVDSWLAERLKAFVRNGGTLLVLTRLSTLDCNGKYYMEPMPVGLNDLFGMNVAERWPIRGKSPKMMQVLPDNADETRSVVDVQICIAEKEILAVGEEYMEMIEAHPGTSVIGKYSSGTLKGQPAITEHEFGSGSAIYQGCWLDHESASKVLCYALEKSGAGAPVETPRNVETLKRGNLCFYLNHRPEPVVLPRLAQGDVLIGNADAEHVRLDAFDVCIIKDEKP